MQALAYSSLAVTLGLALTRPRLGFGQLRVTPALAALIGVAILALGGLVGTSDVQSAATTLWGPMLTLASLMVVAGVAERLGVVAWLAAAATAGSRGSARRLFGLVFLAAVVCAATLNNDTTVLVLTPAVIATVRAMWPERPGLLVPFALAVFAAAGLAPLPLANPMNLVVATAGGVPLARYAALMAPSAVAGWIVTYVVLALLFRRRLAEAGPAREVLPAAAPRGRGAAAMILAAVVIAYAPVAATGGPVWVVALAGALAALILAVRTGGPTAARAASATVQVDTLCFLFGVYLVAEGLRHAGVTAHLGAVYSAADLHPMAIGGVSALGSALFNNHPMAVLNLLTLRDLGAGSDALCAALLGGDLGPRLLPIGSLAGLLWLATLARAGVEVKLREFVTAGLAAAVPALVVSLAVLAAMAAAL